MAGGQETRRLFAVVGAVAPVGLTGLSAAPTGVARVATSTPTAIDLATLGGTSSSAVAVNDSGQGVGYGFPAGSELHASGRSPPGARRPTSPTPSAPRSPSRKRRHGSATGPTQCRTRSGKRPRATTTTRHSPHSSYRSQPSTPGTGSTSQHANQQAPGAEGSEPGGWMDAHHAHHAHRTTHGQTCANTTDQPCALTLEKSHSLHRV